MVFRRPLNIILILPLLQCFIQANAAVDHSFDALWSFRESNLIRTHQRKTAILSRQFNVSNLTDMNGNPVPQYDTVYYFDQLVDHNDPSKGTFKQRFWYTWEFYRPGGPIVLTTPGEANAAQYPEYDLTNSSMTGTMGQILNGAVISIEHRFFGESNPYSGLVPKNLQVHTIAQAIQDLVYFAQNVRLSGMPGGDTEAIRPHKVPWILVGGSYPGALVSWTMNKQPGVFWAGYSTAGVVQPIPVFWEYYEPIRLNMPQNCSTDVGRVIDHLDKLVETGNVTALFDLQRSLNLERAGYTSNFLSWMTVVLRQWRYLSLSTSRRSLFYDFCDALEVRNGVSALENGWGLDHALEAWAQFHHQTDILSALNDDEASQTELSEEEDEYYSEISWSWMICNEVGWIQNGPPRNYTGLTIVSRNIDLLDFENLCARRFPGAFPPSSRLIDRIAATSETYLGWEGKADRVYVVNGRRDPWLHATLSAPSQNIPSTDLRPIRLGNGFHCSDLSMLEGEYDPSVMSIQVDALRTMRKWVAEFIPQGGPVSIAPLATGTGAPRSASTEDASSPVSKNKAGSNSSGKLQNCIYILVVWSIIFNI